MPTAAKENSGNQVGGRQHDAALEASLLSMREGLKALSDEVEGLLAHYYQKLEPDD